MIANTSSQAKLRHYRKFGRQIDGGTLFSVAKGGRGNGAHSRVPRAASDMSLPEGTRLVGAEWLELNRYMPPLATPLYRHDPPNR